MIEKLKPVRSRLFYSATVLWLVLVACGLWVMAKYEFSPGVSASVGGRWPEASHVQRAAGRFTLVMLAHPRCPCTRASIGELAEIMAHCGGRVSASVVFYKPAKFSADWEKSDLWRAAVAIPGVSVMCDVDGVESRRFGSETSGQTLLYDADGRLLFCGGITATRGHIGDNAGREAIVSLATRGVAERVETSVFGCSIRGKCEKPFSMAQSSAPF